MADAGRGEGSTGHIPVAPVEGEEVEEEQEEGGLQKQAQLVVCWKGSCESALFLQGILLQSGLAVCTHSKTDLDSSSPEEKK